MSNKGIDERVRLIIFCVTGLIFCPLLLRDCDNYSNPSDTMPPFYAGFSAIMSPSFDNEIYAPTEPQEADIIGKWIPEEARLSRSNGSDIYFGAGAPPTTLEMGRYNRQKGSRFAVVNLPIPVSQSSRPVIFVSEQGIWNTYREGARWKLYMHRDDGNFSADLIGAQPPYRLRLLFDDGSNVSSMTFKRISR